MPAEHGLRLDEREHGLPWLPGPGEKNPHESIRRFELRSFPAATEGGELLSQRCVLDREVDLKTDHRAEKRQEEDQIASIYEHPTRPETRKLLRG